MGRYDGWSALDLAMQGYERAYQEAHDEGDARVRGILLEDVRAQARRLARLPGVRRVHMAHVDRHYLVARCAFEGDGRGAEPCFWALHDADADAGAEYRWEEATDWEVWYPRAFGDPPAVLAAMRAAFGCGAGHVMTPGHSTHFGGETEAF